MLIESLFISEVDGRPIFMELLQESDILDSLLDTWNYQTL